MNEQIAVLCPNCGKAHPEADYLKTPEQNTEYAMRFCLRAQLATMRSENEGLRTELVKLRHAVGAWQTADGVWVSGKDRVFCACLDMAFPAESLLPGDRKFYYSTKEAAIAAERARP
jgi:hypothetical protein